jgi:hypothetical protein
MGPALGQGIQGYGMAGTFFKRAEVFNFAFLLLFSSFLFFLLSIFYSLTGLAWIGSLHWLFVHENEGEKEGERERDVR